MKSGKGGRFEKLKGDLTRKGAGDPGALAASIGRRKYGKKRFQKMALNERIKNARNK
jgi:hypothetical protein